MEEQNSWLRTKFSHTVYTRVDPRRVAVAPVSKDVVLPFAPLSKDVERKLQKFVNMKKSVSMPVDRDDEDTGTAFKHCASLPLVRSPLQLDRDKVNKPKRASLEIPSSPPMNSESCKTPKARSLVKSPSSMMLLLDRIRLLLHRHIIRFHSELNKVSWKRLTLFDFIIY